MFGLTFPEGYSDLQAPEEGWWAHKDENISLNINSGSTALRNVVLKKTNL